MHLTKPPMSSCIQAIDLPLTLQSHPFSEASMQSTYRRACNVASSGDTSGCLQATASMHWAGASQILSASSAPSCCGCKILKGSQSGMP